MKEVVFSSKLAFVLVLSITFFYLVPLSLAKTQSSKKSQEVNFEEMSLKGLLRAPEGAYLIQKKDIKFLPLYDLQRNMDKKIRSTREVFK